MTKQNRNQLTSITLAGDPVRFGTTRRPRLARRAAAFVVVGASLLGAAQPASAAGGFGLFPLVDLDSSEMRVAGTDGVVGSASSQTGNPSGETIIGRNGGAGTDGLITTVKGAVYRVNNNKSGCSFVKIWYRYSDGSEVFSPNSARACTDETAKQTFELQPPPMPMGVTKHVLRYRVELWRSSTPTTAGSLEKASKEFFTSDAEWGATGTCTKFDQDSPKLVAGSAQLFSGKVDWHCATDPTTLDAKLIGTLSWSDSIQSGDRVRLAVKYTDINGAVRTYTPSNAASMVVKRGEAAKQITVALRNVYGMELIVQLSTDAGRSWTNLQSGNKPVSTEIKLGDQA